MPKLTKRSIEALQTRDAEYFVSDSELPGFGIRIAPPGRKKFARRYRVNGPHATGLEARPQLGDPSSGSGACYAAISRSESDVWDQKRRHRGEGPDASYHPLALRPLACD